MEGYGPASYGEAFADVYDDWYGAVSEPDEVAAVIAELIEHPRAEVYTVPALRQHVLDYFGAEDMGEAESRPPFMAQHPAAR